MDNFSDKILKIYKSGSSSGEGQKKVIDSFENLAKEYGFSVWNWSIPMEPLSWIVGLAVAWNGEEIKFLDKLCNLNLSKKGLTIYVFDVSKIKNNGVLEEYFPNMPSGLVTPLFSEWKNGELVVEEYGRAVY